MPKCSRLCINTICREKQAYFGYCTLCHNLFLDDITLHNKKVRKALAKATKKTTMKVEEPVKAVKEHIEAIKEAESYIRELIVIWRRNLRNDRCLKDHAELLKLAIYS